MLAQHQIQKKQKDPPPPPQKKKKEKKGMIEPKDMLDILEPKCPKVKNCTTDVPTWLSINFVFFKQKAQLVPTMGKHRAKQELETVPPWKLETVPLLGGKMWPQKWYSF